ncbi:bacterioferritin-associated ferredoxin [Ketobacter sp.]|uniref:(2Fe-2S)-binding protein n=1 Tax=Ketobacter sp. TaxID=2083498 RepID=UPI000F1BB755|nr:(2Fe-2S)-binding protein [Ketobacter sp.]MEE2729550.1 (2Fe-2S)-binding protein [Pseudomonadota bacterium]RLU01017.1 MAG: (2Fe-2S)-binding protein [Ketobacter sp.]
MYICLCKDITDHQLRESIRQGACDFSQVRRRCQVGAKCGKCMQEARMIVQNELSIQDQCAPMSCGNG